VLLTADGQSERRDADPRRGGDRDTQILFAQTEGIQQPGRRPKIGVSNMSCATSEVARIIHVNGEAEASEDARRERGQGRHHRHPASCGADAESEIVVIGPGAKGKRQRQQRHLPPTVAETNADHERRQRGQVEGVKEEDQVSIRAGEATTDGITRP